jgi:RNA-directed DNA polymerase
VKVSHDEGVKVLNNVYETDFKGFSYGFRPGRSQHDALDAVTVGITTQKVSWVLDADKGSRLERGQKEYVRTEIR